ncbi:MAG: hypothetical protein WBF48_13690 [Halarcobacter sp.]
MSNNSTKIEEIKRIISSRTKKTNCFSFFNEVCEWLENDKADYYLMDDSIFLFYKANGFYKFYYYVDYFEDIKLANDLLEKYSLTNKVILEFTTKNNQNLDSLINTLNQSKFEIYSELVRLYQGRNVLGPIQQNNNIYELATIDDKNELLEIMHREFDILKDNIPTEDELIDLIKNKSIIIKHIENQIVLIQIYEYTKESLYSRMTWIRKEYRKPKYTVDFHSEMGKFVQDLNIIKSDNFKSYGWIDKNNRNLKINLKMGARLDGITCTIFLYKTNN